MGKRLIDAYRWRRLLASCRLDPAEVSRPAEAPGPEDFIIAGCPRSGTSLLAAQLYQPPSVITVMEPWDGLRLEPRQLFTSLRDEIARGSLGRGRLDIEALAEGRAEWEREGQLRAVSAEPGFLLGVKWPTFWQYLDLLRDTRFLVTVRHPAEVVASFARVGGRLSRGLDYEVRFNAQMNQYLLNATEDPEIRRVLLYEYVTSRILPHLDRPNVMTVRYEDWYTDPARLMGEIESFLGVALAMPVRIAEERSEPYPPRLIQLIDEHAPSARQLGYVY